MQIKSVTESVTFAWWSERWQATWAETPEEVPEFDVSRVGKSISLAWAHRFAHRSGVEWDQYCTDHNLEALPSPGVGLDNYPRLIIQPDKDFAPGTYATQPEGDVLGSLTRIRDMLDSPNALLPGSEARNAILEVANRWGPYALSSNEPLEQPNTLSLRSWAVGICRLTDVLRIVAKLKDDLEIIRVTQALSDLCEYIETQDRLEHPTIGLDSGVRDWPPTVWTQIKGVVKKCDTPREVRQRLANYLFGMFGGSEGLHFGPINDTPTKTQRLELSATRGPIGWAYFLAAQSIAGGTVRQCEASGCSNIITAGRDHRETCSDKCRQRRSRELRKGIPVTNL